jgi:hypothetical protein
MTGPPRRSISARSLGKVQPRSWWMSSARIASARAAAAAPIRFGRLAVPQGGEAATAKPPAPLAHRAGVHAQAGGDLGRAVARQRQQDRAGAIRLAALGRSGQPSQGGASLSIGGERGPARHS